MGKSNGKNDSDAKNTMEFEVPESIRRPDKTSVYNINDFRQEEISPIIPDERIYYDENDYDYNEYYDNSSGDSDGYYYDDYYYQNEQYINPNQPQHRPRPNNPSHQQNRPRPNNPNQPQHRPRPNNPNQSQYKPHPNNPSQPQNRPRPNNPNQPQNRPRPNNPNQPQHRPRPNNPNQPQPRPRPNNPNQQQNRPRPNNPNQPQNRPRPNNPNQSQPRPRPNNHNQPQNRPRPNNPNQPQNRPHPNNPNQPQNRPRPNNPNHSQPRPRPNPKVVSKPRKKHKNPLKKFLLTVFIIFIIIFAVYSALAATLINKMNIVETGQRTMASSGLMYSSDVKNILLIGSDNRDSSEAGRSDSMILLSINKNKKTMTLCSLMRDMYVAIPNYESSKLNAAYSYGGAELLMDTIQENLGIRIDDYVRVNFNCFANIVDAVGGVEITISDEEAQAINQILHDEVNGLMGDPIDSDYLPSGGTYILKGKQALSYSRIRYVGNADFERTERQRTVMQQIFSQMKTANPAMLSSIMSGVMPQVTTNMSQADLYFLSLRLPFILSGYELMQSRIPADNTWSYADVNGNSVISVDFSANKQYIAEELFGGR